MNIAAILAVIGALIVGGVTGATLTGTKEVQQMEGRGQGNGAMMQADDSKPESVDFVSTRPEVATLPIEDLSAAELEGLLVMREEEKLARDVYITLYDQWGLKIFANIAQSEQTHTEAVRDLLVKYDMADPVTEDTVGVFQNETIQDLYNTLVVQGSASELEALKVGALIEDLDIFDLQNYLKDVDNEDIALVYENLERGSRNHLRAFMRQIESRDGAYEAQYLTQEAFDAIKDSEREMGNHGDTEQGGGHGGGSGQGKGGRGWGEK